MTALVRDRVSGLVLPQRKLLRLEQLSEESGLEDFADKEADWAALYAYDVLHGFGHGDTSSLQGADFEGLR